MIQDYPTYPMHLIVLPTTLIGLFTIYFFTKTIQFPIFPLSATSLPILLIQNSISKPLFFQEFTQKIPTFKLFGIECPLKLFGCSLRPFVIFLHKVFLLGLKKQGYFLDFKRKSIVSALFSQKILNCILQIDIRFNFSTFQLFIGERVRSMFFHPFFNKFLLETVTGFDEVGIFHDLKGDGASEVYRHLIYIHLFDNLRYNNKLMNIRWEILQTAGINQHIFYLAGERCLF